MVFKKQIRKIAEQLWNVQMRKKYKLTLQLKFCVICINNVNNCKNEKQNNNNNKVFV